MAYAVVRCDPRHAPHLGSGARPRASLARMTRMTVNGEAVQYRLDPETPLLWALRDASNLTGTKYGCDSRDCGACTVIIDGRAAMSCSVTHRRARRRRGDHHRGSVGRPLAPGAAGLAGRAGDAMCGYCEPGFIMAIAAHAGSEPAPERGADRGAPERLPVRRLCAHPQSDRARLAGRRRDRPKAEYTEAKRLSLGSSEKAQNSP